MIELTQAINAALAKRQGAALTTVVALKGSPPVELGAKMVSTTDGDRVGSLGWDALESLISSDLVAVMETRQAGTKAYEPEPGKQVDVFFELFVPPPMLVIGGAGHIAVPLAAMGKMLDYEVVVIDDRAIFANRDRFPTADRIIVDDYEEAFTSLDIGVSTFIVLVTRGHRHDVLSLRKVIHKPAAFIGMIGSRRRVYAVLKLLKDEGVPITDLEKVRAPIGINIGAQTPAEISICILAEIVNVWRHGPAQGISDLAREKFVRALRRGDREAEL